jgi:hypothetical protein
MGNMNSNNLEKSTSDNLYDIIDSIATYYILTMNFNSLEKLSQKTYCDKLIILTSEIINNNFNNMEVELISQKIKDGIPVNISTKENISYINKDNLDNISIDSDKKQKICIEIAKFYVKIAHIFAAIVMTINPVYTYENENGTTIKTELLKKDTIPKNANTKLLKLNLCNNKINELKHKLFTDTTTNDIIIQPTICSTGADEINTSNNTSNTLLDEPGITELMDLYLDDNYDFSTGKFMGMTETTKTQFRKDLQLFYTSFTGNINMPPEINKFSDIKLKDYNKTSFCEKSNSGIQQQYILNKKDELFIKYAENIQQMIKRASENQSKLLSIINELFIYKIDSNSTKSIIKINNKLTNANLDKIIIKSRQLIINLYITCEMDYLKGIKLYDAIVQSKIFETTHKQITQHEIDASKMISEIKQIVKPGFIDSLFKPPLQPSTKLTQINTILHPSLDPTQSSTINPSPTQSSIHI